MSSGLKRKEYLKLIDGLKQEWMNITIGKVKVLRTWLNNQFYIFLWENEKGFDYRVFEPSENSIDPDVWLSYKASRCKSFSPQTTRFYMVDESYEQPRDVWNKLVGCGWVEV